MISAVIASDETARQFSAAIKLDSMYLGGRHFFSR